MFPEEEPGLLLTRSHVRRVALSLVLGVDASAVNPRTGLWLCLFTSGILSGSDIHVLLYFIETPLQAFLCP